MPSIVKNITSGGNNGFWDSIGSYSSDFCQFGQASGINNHAFLKFTGINIPRGSTITSVSLSLKAGNGFGETCNARIKACHHTSSIPVSTPSQLETARTTYATAASVAWNAVPIVTSPSSYSTPDIVSLVQEVINHSYWDVGDEILILILDNGSGNPAYRIFNDYLDDHSNATLTINYEATYIEDVEGGIVLGGDAANVTTYPPEPVTGGIEFGGDAFWFHYDANNGGVSGGVELAGEVTEAWKFTNTFEGDFLIGGDPAVTCIYPAETVTGGLAFGGDAGQIDYGSVDVYGSILFGGDGNPIATLMGDAGLVFSGEATISFYDANSISCGVSRGVLTFGVRERRFFSAPLSFGVYQSLTTPVNFGTNDGTPEPPVNPIGAYLGGGTVLVSWNTSPSEFVTQYQVWVSDAVDGSYGNFGNDKFPADQTKTRNQGLIQNIPPVGGYVYAQIRAVSVTGKVSNWVQVELGILSKPQTVMRCTAPTNSDIPAGSRFAVRQGGRLIGFQAADDISIVD